VVSKNVPLHIKTSIAGERGSASPRTLAFLSVTIISISLISLEVLTSTYLFHSLKAQIGVQFMTASEVLAFQTPFITIFGLRIFSLIFVLTFMVVMFFKVLGPYQTLLIQAKRFGRSKKKSSNREVDFVIETYKNLMLELNEKKEELEVRYKQERKEKKELKNYNESIINSITAGLLSFDEGEKLVKINPSAIKILNLTEEEDGEDAGNILFPQLREIVKDGIEKQKEISREEILFEDKKKWLGISTSITKNESGKTSGITLLITDITHIKEIEEEIRLKENMASIGEVYAGIAHQFRNPLGSIMGYARLIEKNDKGQASNIQKMIYEIQRMDSLVREFLKFTKPACIKKYPVELTKDIKNSIDILKEREKEVKITLDASEDFFIDGDSTLLQEAWLNIMDNSIESIGEKDGWIKITLQKGKINKKGSKTVKIIFTDSSDGIPEEIKEKVFKPFFTTKDGGTGLGLALCQKIILVHGGHIETVNMPKTSISVCMPIKNF